MKGAARIVMIADDLSGAADCAVTCAVQGLRTVVQLSEEQHSDNDTQVLAMDTATRSMPVERAAATVGRIAASMESAPGRVLFKKLDSLLRGHVGIELAAMLRHLDQAVAVMAPALPSQGRVTIDGRQWMNGQCVADAPAILEGAGLTWVGIDLPTVRRGSAQLAAKMTDLARGHDVLVCDAETDEDLRAVAGAVTKLTQAIWAGSSGLARYIPEAMGISGISGPVEQPIRFRGPILIAVGSRSPLAHEQAREAINLGGVRLVTLRPGCAEEALESGNDVIVAIDPNGDSEEDPSLCAALASWIQPHIKNFGALILTGGETARAVLVASGISSLRVLQEVEPGVPLMVSLGARTMPVITKSGSFGNRKTLSNCLRVLRGLKLE